MFEMYGKEKDHKIPEGAEVVLLTSVSDFALLAIVRGMLEDENIPYLAVEPHGSAMGMIVGFSMYGADIYISKEDEERARAEAEAAAAAERAANPTSEDLLKEIRDLLKNK